MKTYQIDIEESLFPYFKTLMRELPIESFRLYTKDGYELNIDDAELELSDEAKRAIDEGIEELDRGEGIPHEQVVAEMQAKYPQLKFK